MARREGPAGVRERGIGARGLPGNLGDLAVSGVVDDDGGTVEQREVVQRKTAKDRLSRTLRRISMWCSSNRHRPIKEQHAALVRKLRGHDAYYGITGNARALVVMRQWVRRIWQKWLNRRSWKAGMTWTRMNQLLGVFPLPPARVVHSIYRAANP